MSNIYYKSVMPNGCAWYDGKTKWTKKPMPRILGNDTGPCGIGYHLAKTPEAAIGYGRFPCRLAIAEPCGHIVGEDHEKIRVTSARIVRWIPKPKWVKETERFLATIPGVKWMSLEGDVDPAWRVFDTHASAHASARASAYDDSAYDSAYASACGSACGSARASARASACASAYHASAYDSACASAYDSACASARDSALMAAMCVCSDLPLDQKHRDHAKARWDVWKRGYGLLCDVGGILFVYRRIA